MKYCVFVDVLGYGSIVTDPNRSEHQKLDILNGIYSNLASQMLIDINEANQGATDPIYVKSFSDCFYLESTDITRILHAVKNIFRNAFTFYSSSENQDFEYTALLRGGISKNWTRKFMDLAAVVNNNKTMNPVGLGVAEAYYISEKTYLSGMRILLDEKVFNDLKTTNTSIEGRPYFKYDYDLNRAQYKSYFKKIHRNEIFSKVSLYELIWTFDTMNTCTTDGIDTLESIKSNFSKHTLRHYRKTAELLYHGLLLTDCKKSLGTKYDEQIDFLKKEKRTNPVARLFYPIQQLMKF